jgi:hypothetical protein
MYIRCINISTYVIVGIDWSHQSNQIWLEAGSCPKRLTVEPILVQICFYLGTLI